MRFTFVTLSTLLTTLHALTITEPHAGSSVDPSKPIVVRWSSTSSDPSSFNIVLQSSTDNSYAYGGANANTLASNVKTSDGTYTIPANAIAAFGTGFSISAQSASGDNLGSSGDFLLGYGSNQVVTGSNGQLSLVPSSGGAAAQTTLSSLTFDTSGVTGSMTATYFPSTDLSATVTGGFTSATSLESLTLTSGSVTGSMTIMTSTTRSSSHSGSSSSASSSSSAAAATTNAQPRIGAGKEIMSVAGLLAGLVALVA